MLNKTTAAPEKRRPWSSYRVGAPEEHLSGSVLLRSSTRVGAPQELAPQEHDRRFSGAAISHPPINVYSQAIEMPYACWRVGFWFCQMFHPTVFSKIVGQALLRKSD